MRGEKIAADWKRHAYYDKAEQESSLNIFWQPSSIFARFFKHLNLEHIVELACGHGRHVQKYMNLAKKITLVDVNEENIEYCKTRFQGNDKIDYLVNTGSNFQGIPDDSVTSIFCYDAMVHFELVDVALYLADSYRILRKGDYILFHHSNYDKNPGAWYTANPHSRNFMNSRIFCHLARSAGFKVIAQQILDWGFREEERDIDCLSLCVKE